MSAPRIDTFRRTIDAVVERLLELRADVGDVHSLAYDRHRAGEAIKVSGGSHDYALDEHGDINARELYIDVAAKTIGLARNTEKALTKLRRYLNRDGHGGRRDGSADATQAEIVEALAARQRRTQRGEYTPHPVVAQQVKIPTSMIEAQGELDLLRSAVHKVMDRAQREHDDCLHADGRRKRSRIVNKDILTPKEREAWDRSLRVADNAKAS